ncbi:MAG TPA: NnrU family protein [Candidatus Binataceae bacterium]|nr:NnrU family protein [Candidatus Binataceae bacterium]
MGAVGMIALWAVLFLAGHFILSADAVRGAIVGATGEQPFRGIYSLVALGTFIPLVVAFGHHKHAGPMLWYLRGVAPLRWLVWLLMLAALIMWVASLITPNPVALGAPDNPTPRGMLKLTRHPGFVAFAIFGFAHMLMNGWVGDVIFFGTFPALGIFGGLHQDRRKLRSMGERYRKFVAETSFMPGAALLSGRQRCDPREDFPLLAVVIGTALTIVLVAIHPWAFGGHPLG